MKTHLHAFRLALSFLTRIPVSSSLMASATEFPLSLLYFPIVGLIVGLVGAGVTVLADMVLPLSWALLCGMAATVALTGSFHEDGLADSADGLIGGHDPTSRLEIMKDSRIGTHGTLWVWFFLMAKFLTLSAVSAGGTAFLVAGIAAAHVLGRTSSLLLILALPYVGTGASNSKSRAFIHRADNLVVAAGAGMGLLIAIVLLGINLFLPILIALISCTLACGWYFRSKIGGITGDCLGCANVLSECSILAALALATGQA
jgi:adenosylcobinamide-GDP ribazoletransferase